jgi:ankyrin repeat protein
LHYACVHGNLDSVRLLVEAGADISPQDKDGDFPLSLAAGYDHPDVISYLLEKGASVNCQSTKDGEAGTAIAHAHRL